MLWYYKRKFLHIAGRLNDLRDDPKNLSLLFDLQMVICKEIFHAERKQAYYQTRHQELKRALNSKPAKDDSRRIRLALEQNEKKRKECQWLQYIWRCFGDGIAFTYVNKWGIKPFHFQTKSPEPKQAPGYLGGKSGLAGEIAVLLEAKRHGVPAVLADITNTIRYGDVCLLGGDEPYVMEIKSGAALSKRAKRQIADIEAIHSYLEDEVANDVRGTPTMRRVATSIPERNYLETICPLIRTALECGFHTVMPERGIRYSAFRVGEITDYSRTLEGMTRPAVTILNTAKNESAWSIYYPFTLSINDPALLYEFVRGKVFVIVATDMDAFSVVARERGFHFEILDHPDYAFKLTEMAPSDSDPMTFTMSHGFVARIAFEFLSWEWIVDNDRASMPTYKHLARTSSDA